jgi:cation:H+ antiporter
MDIVLALILLIVSLIVLDQFSHLTITNAIKVSDITGLRKTTVGFILLAFSTSLPELSVAFIASLGGDAAISAGNVIGSNIVNICLIIGLAALLVALKRPKAVSVIPSFAKEELGSLYFGLFVASIIPLSLVYLVGANWLIGLILILVFVLYTYQLMKIRIPIEEGGGVSEEMKRKLRLYIALTLLGVIGVLISAYFIVESAVAIAEFANVPRTLIGATIIAFGTSLPEFSLDVRAFLKGHSALAFGDVVGSCFINITLILGLTLFVSALVGSPLTMNMLVFLDVVVFSLIANLFLWYFLSMGRLSWREGAILLFIYVLFLATSLGAVHLRVQPS